MVQMLEWLGNYGATVVITAGVLIFIYKVAGKFTKPGGLIDQWGDLLLQEKQVRIEAAKIHAEANDRHSLAAERMAVSYEQANQQLRLINEEAVANRLHHHDPNSPFSAVTIHRCLMHATNLLDQYAQDNAITTWEPHIEAIREELVRVKTIQDASKEN